MEVYNGDIENNNENNKENENMPLSPRALPPILSMHETKEDFMFLCSECKQRFSKKEGKSDPTNSNWYCHACWTAWVYISQIINPFFYFFFILCFVVILHTQLTTKKQSIKTKKIEKMTHK